MRTRRKESTEQKVKKNKAWLKIQCTKSVREVCRGTVAEVLERVRRGNREFSRVTENVKCVGDHH